MLPTAMVTQVAETAGALGVCKSVASHSKFADTWYLGGSTPPPGTSPKCSRSNGLSIARFRHIARSGKQNGERPSGGHGIVGAGSAADYRNRWRCPEVACKNDDREQASQYMAAPVSSKSATQTYFCGRKQWMPQEHDERVMVVSSGTLR